MLIMYYTGLKNDTEIYSASFKDTVSSEQAERILKHIFGQNIKVVSFIHEIEGEANNG